MNEPKKHPRRRWWQYFTQFSLRTLLIVVTASAVACWWFLQPESRDEELFGKALKLRRQVTVVKADPAMAGQTAAGLPADEATFINAGSWQILDEHGGPLVAGRYDGDVAHGKWTIYHRNGRKAAEGRVVGGLRSGLWKAWDEEGRPVSEVTYLPAASPRLRGTSRERWQGCSPLIPVVGVTVLSAPMGSPLGFQFGGGCLVGMPTPPRPWVQQVGSIRHGPCRAWHATGKLRFVGAYEDDLRSGEWTYYDEQGRLTEQGPYQADERHGTWTIRDWAAGQGRRLALRDERISRSGMLPASTPVEYIAGLLKTDHERLLARLANDLASGNIRRQVAAAERLEELGSAGTPLLLRSLADPSDDVKLLALRALVRTTAIAASSPLSPRGRGAGGEGGPLELALHIEPLLNHSDPRISLRALFASYLSRPGDRTSLFERLAKALKETDRQELALEILLALFRADEGRRTPTLRLMIDRISRAQNRINGTGGSSPPADYIRTLAGLEGGVIPHLEAVLSTANADARLLIVQVLQDMASRGEPQYVQAPPGAGEWHWPIPPETQPLIDRAKADPDERVRTAAEFVGRQSAYGGGGSQCFGGFSASGMNGGGVFSVATGP